MQALELRRTGQSLRARTCGFRYFAGDGRIFRQRIADEFAKHPEAGMVYHRLLELNSETNERKEAEFRALSGFLPDKPDELFWYVPYPTSCLAFRKKFL